MARKINCSPVLVGTVFATLLLAPLAEAVCVHPGGDGGCESTIQAGVDATAAGGTVDIAKGVYVENVVVPPGKDGLTLRGRKRKSTILDADAPNTGVGLAIQSTNVRVESLTIRNGAVHGATVMAGTSGFGLLDVEIRGSQGSCLSIEGDDSTVASSSFRGCDHGILLLANGLDVSHSTFQQTSRDGINFVGKDVTVTKCEFSTMGDDGVGGEGDNLTVQDCKFEALFSQVVDSSGSNMSIIGNQVSIAEGGMDIDQMAIDGFLIDNITIADNKMEDLFGRAVSWDCSEGCTMATFTGNKIRRVMDNDAFELQMNAGTMTVARNKFRQVRDIAINVDLSDSVDATIAGNNLRDVGTEGHPSIDIQGNGASIVDNKIKGSGYHALRVVEADQGVTVAGNKVTRGFHTAIAIGDDDSPSTVGALVSENKLLSNLGAGIYLDDDAVDTDVADNKARKNSVDFCDLGTNTMLAGSNKFGTLAPCN